MKKLSFLTCLLLLLSVHSFAQEVKSKRQDVYVRKNRFNSNLEGERKFSFSYGYGFNSFISMNNQLNSFNYFSSYDLSSGRGTNLSISMGYNISDKLVLLMNYTRNSLSLRNNQIEGKDKEIRSEFNWIFGTSNVLKVDNFNLGLRYETVKYKRHSILTGLNLGISDFRSFIYINPYNVYSSDDKSPKSNISLEDNFTFQEMGADVSLGLSGEYNFKVFENLALFTELNATYMPFKKIKMTETYRLNPNDFNSYRKEHSTYFNLNNFQLNVGAKIII